MRRLLLSLLFAPLTAHAWGPDGHQTVATIAAGLLKGTPAEARVKALLGDMTLAQAALWGDCVKGISPRHDYRYPAPGKYPECAPLETPERIAEMADYVRRNDRQCRIGLDEDSCNRQTHYADVAVQRSRYVQGFVGTRPDDVVGATRQAILVLQGKPTSGQPHLKSPREALIVLTHLVGDLHQPLHVGAVYLDERGRRVDPDKTGFKRDTFTVGGNSLWLRGTGPAPIKLHTAWDSVPSQLKPARVDARWLATARRVKRDTGAPGDRPVEWGTQALEQARLAFDGMKFSERQGDRWEVELPRGYEKRANDIKRYQLTLAGARLAQLLQSIWP